MVMQCHKQLMHQTPKPWGSGPCRRCRGVKASAVPVKPSSTTSQLIKLTEIHDRQKTTYTNSTTPGTPGMMTVQHEQQDQQQGQQPSLPGRQQLLDALKALYLPAGYPSSVTDDYLAYQLCTVPAHIMGWLSISLTTSSLLKAVGINAGPVGATAAAAAIKWIVKDGIGAAGRLLVGGRLGLEFDDDPRRWRMAAEALTSAGLAMEIATAIYPSQFLLLASVGNFTKAVGKGMGRPVFRVVQTHFAASGNVGAVAAKEEVWEVSAQLAGYAISVAVLQALQDTGSWQTVVGLWAGVQGLHVTARYLALRQLRFRYLNQKRATLLVAAHVRGKPLPDVAQANQQEPMLLPVSGMQPCVTFGCSIEHAWGVSAAQLPAERLAAWVQLYRRQGYLLVWRQQQAYVIVKQDCQQLQPVLLRAMWQAAWLEANGSGRLVGSEQQQHQKWVQPRDAAGSSNSSSSSSGDDLVMLQASIEAMEGSFDEFLEEARAGGWKLDVGVFKVGRFRVEVEQQL